MLLFFSQAYANLNNKLSQYSYEDTKKLVLFVESAAALVEKNGQFAFASFSPASSRWRSDEYYLFVYDISGNCVFHPIEPSLVGKNMMDFRDIDGRPVIQMITDIGKKPEPNASGWVFYKWEEPWQSLSPQWKTSYIRKVVAPDKKVYLVGCGLYNMKIEKAFIEQQVNKAAEMLLAKGKNFGFLSLVPPFLNFDIMDSYIVVVNSLGDIEVSPAFPSLHFHKNIFNLIDKSGKNIGEQTRRALANKDRIWISYLWPKGEEHHLARKLLYVRKIDLGNETFYLWMDFFPAMPVWMK